MQKLLLVFLITAFNSYVYTIKHLQTYENLVKYVYVYTYTYYIFISNVQWSI